MNQTSYVKRFFTGAAGVALAATMGAGCSAGASTQQEIAGPPPASTPVGIDDFYRVTMNITNQSNLTWNLTDTAIGHDGTGSGWLQRPVTLAPGQTEVVSAYSAFNGQGLSLTYVAAEAPTIKVVLVAQDPAIGSNNTNGTKGTAPIGVNASIAKGKQTTATFSIYGSY